MFLCESPSRLRACLIGVTLAVLAAGASAPAAAEAFLLIEADSGKVLQAENATYPWYPASVTKLMTTYVTLRAIKDGRITLDTPFTVSANAMAQAPTKMGFKVGTIVTVDNALKMMMVKSANDMAVLLAEGVSGSVETFADEMNAAAQRLGMTQTSYVNPNGLPADGQITSARDLAILARALIREFPEYDFYWHVPAIKFGRRVFRNYNPLIDRYPGADGMKTGFICASGFNLVATASRGNRRLIAVVLGAPSGSVRAAKAARLLEQGFNSGGLSWLMPSLGSVDQLAPIDAAPPNLREEMCGPHRKRPAAEDEEVEVNNGTGTGDSGSPIGFVLSNLRGSVPRIAELLGQAVASLPPVEVFVGRSKPTTAAAAAAQEAHIVAAKPNRGKKAKAPKAAKSATAKTDTAPPAEPTAAPQNAATSGRSAKSGAKPAKPAAKSALAGTQRPKSSAAPAPSAATAARPQPADQKHVE